MTNRQRKTVNYKWLISPVSTLAGTQRWPLTAPALDHSYRERQNRYKSPGSLLLIHNVCINILLKFIYLYIYIHTRKDFFMMYIYQMTSLMERLPVTPAQPQSGCSLAFFPLQEGDFGKSQILSACTNHK